MMFETASTAISYRFPLSFFHRNPDRNADRQGSSAMFADALLDHRRSGIGDERRDVARGADRSSPS